MYREFVRNVLHNTKRKHPTQKCQVLELIKETKRRARKQETEIQEQLTDKLRSEEQS
jgi:hypothetical protein